MKKSLIVFIMLIGVVAYGQNTFKYEVRANGGLRVGGSTFAEIDSITSQAGKLRIMSGAVLQTIAGHVLEADTATMLSKYARKESPTFTGVVKLATDTLATRAYARSVGEGGSMVYPGAGIPLSTGSTWGTSITNNSANWDTAYSWGDHSGLYLPVAGTAAAVTGFTPASGSLTLSGADALTINTTAATNVTFPASGTLATTQNINDSILSGVQIRTLDSDTIPLFIFGLGSGHSSDTAVFNNGRLAGAFYNAGSDTLYVTELRGVLVEGTGTETIDVQVSWDVNMKDATPTNLNTTALTVTSMTSGTVDTAFDNNGIPPDVWVWCSLSGASANNKPTMLTLTMTGYRRNRSY